MMEKYGEREDVTEQDLRNCIDDVEALKQAGKLYTPDTFADMAGTFKERSGDVVKALCLHVAHTCNLNCSYCFASQGKYHGDRALMSFEVGKQALDFLMDHSGSRTNLEVDFFGGEPLMNWDVVKQLVEYARSVEKERGKNFCFTLTTNGRGFQYTGRVFRQKLVQAGMTQSMSRVLRVALTTIPWKASGIS